MGRRTDVLLVAKKLLTHVVKGLENLLSALLGLALEPWNTLEGALLHGAAAQNHIDETHADNVAIVSVDALVGVLGIRLMPPSEGALGVFLTELW